MRMFFYIGLLLLGLAFAAAATETAFHGLPGAGGRSLVPAHDLWYTFSPESLFFMESTLTRLSGGWLWDPVFLTLLKLPAWLIYGGPGLALVLVSRRRSRAHGEDSASAPMESVDLFNHLARSAKREFSGEDHGPTDLMPQHPIPEEDIISAADADLIEEAEEATGTEGERDREENSP